MARRARQKTTAAVADALHSAAIHLLRRVRRQDERSGIGPARLSALSVLVFGGPMKLADLARAEQVKPPTMSKIFAGLEAGGLARRTADPSDARIVRVEATPRGVALLQEGRRRRVRQLKLALDGIDAADVATVAKAAEIIERISKVL